MSPTVLPLTDLPESFEPLPSSDGRRWVRRPQDGAVFELDTLNTWVLDLDDECYWTLESLQRGLAAWVRVEDLPGVIPIVGAWTEPGSHSVWSRDGGGSILLAHATPPDAVSLQDMTFTSAVHLVQALVVWSDILESIRLRGWESVYGGGYGGHGALSPKVLMLSPTSGAAIRFEPDRYLEWDPLGRSHFSPGQGTSHEVQADVYAFARTVGGVLIDEQRIPNRRLRTKLLASAARTLHRATALQPGRRGFGSVRRLSEQLAADWGVKAESP